MANGTGKPPRGKSDIEGASEPIIGASIDPRDVDGSGSAGSGGSDNVGSGGSTGNDGTFDPSIHVSPDKRNADGSYTRKRGRRKGGSNSYRKAKVSENLEVSIQGLTKALVFVHAGLAEATKTPELSITENEGHTLAEASINLMVEFDITPDPKTQAIIGMIVAAGMVYGPKVYMIRARKEQQAREKPASANAAGTGGIYAHDGTPLGTTEFTEVNEPLQ